MGVSDMYEKLTKELNPDEVKKRYRSLRIKLSCIAAANTLFSAVSKYRQVLRKQLKLVTRE